MPIKTKNDLPAKAVMENENIFVMDEKRAITQDIRPIKIAILNLMPLKEETEVQLLRSLSNTPLQVDVTFLTTGSYVGKNTPVTHLNKFYETYEDVKDRRFDGLIITGAPVEQLDFTQVAYWEELKEIMDWSAENVTSTLHLCWGALAGLHYRYNIGKYKLEEKLSGVYTHEVFNRKTPLVRGFDDEFRVPHSRYTHIDEEAVMKDERLLVLARSKEAGIYLVLAEGGKNIFVLGHPEYDRMTLDSEYRRDIGKGLNPKIPCNYYPGDDPDKRPLLSWRAHCNTLYTNWLNYYVYQNTPYEW